MGFKCNDCIDLLLDYVDGQLSNDVVSRLETHMGGCEPCQNFLKTYKETPTVCRHALQKKMPDDVARSLSSFLAKELKKSGT